MGLSSRPSKYIGDAGVAKFLETYKSHTPFYIARMRVLGALASPHKDLLPVMVISSFWAEGEFPKFVTKDEANQFFSTFMGLWRRMEKMAQAQNNLLSACPSLSTHKEAISHLEKRILELEAGFIEGFWGGVDDLPMPSASAALIDALGDEAVAYQTLLEDVKSWSDYNDTIRTALRNELLERDTTLEDTFKALLILKHKNTQTSH